MTLIELEARREKIRRKIWLTIKLVVAFDILMFIVLVKTCHG